MVAVWEGVKSGVCQKMPTSVCCTKEQCILKQSSHDRNVCITSSWGRNDHASLVDVQLPIEAMLLSCGGMEAA